ncbi:MAG: hypothetical protein NVSMB19_08240 [Vulcanimicrobiaceae bacterium]
MNETRATIAIVRRHIDRHFALDWTLQFVIVLGLTYAFVTLFGGMLLVAIAVLAATRSAEETQVRSLRRLTFFTVPLYGRQLARAHAIAPSLLALSLPLGYAAGAALRGHPLDAEGFVTAVSAVVVATLVALSASFRDGRDRALYVALALGAGVAIAATYTPDHVWFRVTLALAVAEGFFALRAFGETLARYDPLPDP